jgi:hypothetical protein
LLGAVAGPLALAPLIALSSDLFGLPTLAAGIYVLAALLLSLVLFFRLHQNH